MFKMWVHRVSSTKIGGQMECMQDMQKMVFVRIALQVTSSSPSPSISPLLLILTLFSGVMDGGFRTKFHFISTDSERGFTEGSNCVRVSVLFVLLK